ncbi:DNA-binding transcriptional ArsR family regulator [Amycolatopsis lexingtonensis]|uniref:DNA-binding transcriptional ArsR family regulator n=1 Tax=Amycolatopsis lexingtonensis TaxID=218822 RepID=A0ABR9HZZ5_9PSEU|nr:metalloregulator ArsR/SmtB family transcription factor [Amycolatopsis lexingtonensis]MBE1496516.1 DNA-binding transcriptional ArsR family regulator [Amycolatopsis lexingtonensis]
MEGDADIARTAALFADPARVRVLLALGDGRALAASVLAAEARLSAQGVSAHLAKLRAAGLVVAEKSGRHRFYRLAGPDPAELLETLARFSPSQPVTSLREGTRAEALRTARTCYDHLAGRLGVAVTSALLSRGALAGAPDTRRRAGDRISAPLREHPYTLGPSAEAVFGKLGIDVDAVASGRRPLLKFCLDWSEQRHHLAGALGAAVATRFMEAGWVRRRAEAHRALRLTPEGARALEVHLGLADLAA